MKIPFLEKLNSTPLIFDGAMGTLLYEKGIFLNACYDELNLSRPDLIKSIHQEYIGAGADVILTNTFGANRIKLEKFGLSDKVKEINHAGVRIAKEAAAESEVYILASVGSNLHSGEILTSENIDAIKESYREQISALVESGIDGIIFETFLDIEELILAAEIAKEFDIPVIGSMTLTKEMETPKGLSITVAMEKLNDCAFFDALGLNCSIGPHAMLSAVEKVIDKITKPLIVQPNAGHPQKMDGRMIYLSTPEYFTSYCKNYISLGVMGVGGCCGTNPEHIKEMSRTIKALTGVKKHVEINKIELENADIKVTPTEEKSNFNMNSLIEVDTNAIKNTCINFINTLCDIRKTLIFYYLDIYDLEVQKNIIDLKFNSIYKFLNNTMPSIANSKKYKKYFKRYKKIVYIDNFREKNCALYPQPQKYKGYYPELFIDSKVDIFLKEQGKKQKIPKSNPNFRNMYHPRNNARRI